MSPLPPDEPLPGAGRRDAAAPAKKPRKPRTPKAAAAPVVVSAPAAPPLRLVAIVAAATLTLDQAIKWLVVQHLDLATLGELDVFYPYLNLRMAWNEGVNFGLLSSGAGVMRWVLIAVAVAVCIWVAIWVRRSRPGRFGRVAAGLLIGGALGNVIDRLVYGAVADFLNMSLPNWSNPYSFNVADITIFAGAIGLVLQPPPPRAGTNGADKPRDGRGKTG